MRLADPVPFEVGSISGADTLRQCFAEPFRGRASVEDYVCERLSPEERYRRRYPGRDAMGALTLEPVELRSAWGTEVSLLDDAVPSRVHAVSVVARWTLKRAGQPDASGLTLIVLRPHGDSWQIVQDASM